MAGQGECGLEGMAGKGELIVIEAVGIAPWRDLAERVLHACSEVFVTANVPVTEKRYSDPKFLAMTLLARTISNMRGAILLLDHRRPIEARVIVRCCLENSFWMASLHDGRDAFVKEMAHDEISHQHARGQNMFAHKVPLDKDLENRLAQFMRRIAKQAKGKKTLSPKSVAHRTAFRKSYVIYEQLSSDSAHPSLTALNRHVVQPTDTTTGGIDMEPVAKDDQLAESLQYLTMAALRVSVGANEIIGGTPGGEMLQGLLDEYMALTRRRDATTEAR